MTARIAWTRWAALCLLAFWGAGAARAEPLRIARLSQTFYDYVLPFPADKMPRARLSITAVGDIMMHDSQLSAGELPDKEGYSFGRWFDPLRPTLSDADLTIGNLETVLAGEEQRYTGYPMFNSPDALAPALKDAGFDILITANNHSLDRRREGVVRTLDVLDANQIMHTGSYRSPEEKDDLFLLRRNRITLAVLAYTYGTNGIEQWIPEEERAYLVNYIEQDAMLGDIGRARKEGADFVIVYLHWGAEYQHKPAPSQVRLADALFEGGADAILGCHPHVLQPAMRKQIVTREGISKNVFIAYSMGNFVSDQRGPHKQTGAMVQLQVEKDFMRQTCYLKKAEVRPTWVHCGSEGGVRTYAVMDLRKELAALDALEPGTPPPLPLFQMRPALELAERVLSGAVN